MVYVCPRERRISPACSLMSVMLVGKSVVDSARQPIPSYFSAPVPVMRA